MTLTEAHRTRIHNLIEESRIFRESVVSEIHKEIYDIIKTDYSFKLVRSTTPEIMSHVAPSCTRKVGRGSYRYYKDPSSRLDG